MKGRAIFSVMRRTNPIRLLARALWLAVVGLVMAAGAASAHDGRMSISHQSHWQVQTAQAAHHVRADVSGEIPMVLDLSVQAGPGSLPCSEDQSAGHVPGQCCTVACHAALAAPPVEPMGTLGLPSSRIVGLTGMLVGRSTDRTERPPKLS
jgi:hypothetical protein